MPPKYSLLIQVMACLLISIEQPTAAAKINVNISQAMKSFEFSVVQPSIFFLEPKQLVHCYLPAVKFCNCTFPKPITQQW